MRTTLLSPDHSSWWLLSPDLTLFFDRVVVLRSDYDQTLAEAGRSTYHSRAATHLQSLLSEAPCELEVVDSVPGLIDPARRSNVESSILEQFVAAARDEENPVLEPADVIQLTADAYADWIRYDERKASFLRADEPHRSELEAKLADWRAHLSGLRVDAFDPGDPIGSLLADRTNAYVLKNLLYSAWQAIQLVDELHFVHDPMLTEYLPVIDLLERLLTGVTKHRKYTFPWLTYSFHVVDLHSCNIP